MDFVKKNNKKWLILLPVIFAFIFLPDTSPFRGDSVLHMTHDYFNFTKSMLEGKVLYTDLYDHKGLLLYALYLIPAAISKTSFTGVFLFEGLASGAIALSCYLYCRTRYDWKTSYLFTWITLIVIRLSFHTPMLNTEPICLIVIFCLLAYTEKKKYKSYNYFHYAVFGVIFALLFWMKFPMVIVLFPFWLYFLVQSLMKKKTGSFIICNLFSACAAICTSIPVILYHIKSDSLKEMLHLYFGSVSFEPFQFIWTISYAGYAVIIILAIAFLYIIKRRKERPQDVFFFLCFLFVFYLTNNAGVRNYTAIFMVFLIPFSADLMMKNKRNKVLSVLCLLSIAGFNLWLSSYGSSLVPAADYMDAKSIAEKYDINNRKIFYVGEDNGLGSYSEEGFLLKHQWHPSRIAYESDQEEYERILNYINTQEFEYVCIKKADYDTEIDWEKLGRNHCFANIVSAVQNNYTVVDSFLYKDEIPTIYYLCRKTKNF